MNERAVAMSMHDSELESTYEHILMGGVFSIMVVIVLQRAFQSLARTRLEVSSVGYPAVAGNTGLVWIQVTPLGQPNQVKIIAENSTGAFEEVLLGLTT